MSDGSAHCAGANPGQSLVCDPDVMSDAPVESSSELVRSHSCWNCSTSVGLDTASGAGLVWPSALRQPPRKASRWSSDSPNTQSGTRSLFDVPPKPRFHSQETSAS